MNPFPFLFAFTAHVIGTGLVHGILHLQEAINAGNTDPRIPIAIETLSTAWVTINTLLHHL